MTSDSSTLASKFSEPQGPSAETAWSRYLIADMNAMVNPTDANFTTAFQAAPTDSARKNVDAAAARNGIKLAASPASQAVSTGLRMGSR